MAETTTLLPTERPTERIIYRPLSGLAVAGFVIAVVFTVLIIIFGLLALVSGTPLALGLWVMGFPISAAILSLLGRQQIRQSEGTRTGMGMASWGWWLSLIFGLGYLAFHGGTYLAVWWQAEEQGKKFFAQLQEGKIIEAFNDHLVSPTQRLMTPDVRKMMLRYGMPGEKGQKGPLVQFQEHDIVRIVHQGGPDAVIQPLGVSEWDYVQNGYTVKETYRVTTNEGVFDILLTLRSATNENTGARDWAVIWNEQAARIVEEHLTDQGKALRQWRGMARSFANSWLMKRGRGWVNKGLPSAYLDTVEPQERDRLNERTKALRAIGTVSVPPVGSGLAPQLLGLMAAGHDSSMGDQMYLPGFEKFLDGGVFVDDKFEAPDKMKDEILKLVKRDFHDPVRMPMRTGKGDARPLPFSKDARQLRFVVEVNMAIFTDGTPGVTPPKYQADGSLVIETDPGPLDPNRPPRMHVVQLNLLRGDEAGAGRVPSTKVGPGGTAPMMPPGGPPLEAPPP